MGSFLETVVILLLWLLAAGISLAISLSVLYVIHFVLTGPMRRAERTRFFLDLIETALERGQSVEETLVSAAQSRDQTLGGRFQLLAATLGSGRRLADALAMVPNFLQPQINAMLRVGQQIGDLRKVLPACRQFLRDSISETRSAVNYVVVLAFVVTPLNLFVFTFMSVKILPVMQTISVGMNSTLPFFAAWVWDHFWFVVIVQVVLMVILWSLALIYAAGPRALEWLPILHRIYHRLPWRRKRMTRDFSAMLAVLLDARVPEAEAVTLAADCTHNRVIQKRALRVARQLNEGVKLTEAIQLMDDRGEFRWRLTNATHGGEGFRNALAGWHEALDAKAFQQEQAAAHSVTTALVVLNGVFVGTVVTSVFAFLVSVINAGVIW